jgi:putative transposase
MRRSKSIETLLPIHYLKDLSTDDLSVARGLLGKDAPVLSQTAIMRTHTHTRTSA